MSIAGRRKIGSFNATFHALAIMPSLDQNPPISGIPIIDILPTNIAVAVIGILLAKPPIFSID